MEATVSSRKPPRSSPLRELCSERGALLFPCVLVCVFWLPIFLWLAKFIVAGIPRLPEGFDLRPLALRTIYVAGVCAALSTLLAYPVALLSRTLSRGGVVLTNLAMFMPLIMSALARNYSWRAMLASADPLQSLGWSALHGQALQYTALSVYLVMTCVFVPVAYFILVQGAAAVTRQHVDAARTLGATENCILASIVLPQMHRAAFLAVGLIFAMSAGYFITPEMIGGSKMPLLGNAVYDYVKLGDFRLAATIALAFLGFAIVPIAAIMIMAFRRRYLVAGK